MLKESNNTALIIGAAILGIGAYMLFKEKQASSGGGNNNAAPPETPVFDINRKYPIIFGAYNQDLKKLQYSLGINQYGTLDPNTISALNFHGIPFNSYSRINTPEELNAIINKVNIYAGN